MKYDYLIVGAGFAGSVAAERLAAVYDKKVLVVDRRPHVGGNAYDTLNEHGVLIHQYGPHIFHTNSQQVVSYLSQFTGWRPYVHRVLTSVNGQLLPMPVNRDTINRLYGTNMTEPEVIRYLESVAESVAEVRTSEDVVVSKVGRDLYEKFFRNYTRKQWGLDPSELDASVIARVPIRTNTDDRYFTDDFQAMPDAGYTALFKRMLAHPNISVSLDTDYRDVATVVEYSGLIFTGPIDEFFDYRYGPLEYRSLRFRYETVRADRALPAAVINYPNEHDYTRVTEFKQLTSQVHRDSTLVYEYPCADGDPYYPVPRPANRERFLRYRSMAEQSHHTYFTGRLGTYRYYNMDQVVAQSLTLCGRIMGSPAAAILQEG
ncbi:UDP-galactopyranose mutase [Gemmatimonas sp.]|uniref:UDP-galactopyranose mutase n=1 Tax=Gemmatimonas sp. TaxID=1962908 RepID=UPI003568BA0A